MDWLAYTLPWHGDGFALPVGSVLPAWVWGIAMLVALAVDRWLGEPPVRWHPVVWMGNYLGWAGRLVPRRAVHATQTVKTVQPVDSVPDYKAFCLAALMWCAGAALVLIASVMLQNTVVGVLTGALPSVMAHVLAGGPSGLAAWGADALSLLLVSLLLGLLLKPLLAWAMLEREVLAVEQALDPAQGGSLANGRARLAWLVSRDTTGLTETQVRESAIESLAENLNDSVVAPLFWFVVLGLPGAALYRFANTADAMWGYRGVYKGQNWEWAGKWAAWADDVLSWIPARITGMCLLLVASVESVWARFGQLRCEAAQTPSPNSGWPMAAMALVLDVRLQKPGVYALHASGRAATPPDTHMACLYASKALLALVFIAQSALIFIAIIGL